MTRTTIEPLAAGAVPGWTLGWRLKRALAFADLGTEEIAQELGVVRATISRWTNDKGAPPRAIYVRQLALRTGVSYDWLMRGDAAQADLGAAPDATTERDAGAADDYSARKRREMLFVQQGCSAIEHLDPALRNVTDPGHPLEWRPAA